MLFSKRVWLGRRNNSYSLAKSQVNPNVIIGLLLVCTSMQCPVTSLPLKVPWALIGCRLAAADVRASDWLIQLPIVDQPKFCLAILLMRLQLL